MVSAQKTILRIVSVLLIGFFASAVQAQEKATPAEHEAAIRNARITQTKALAANDLDTVVRYWTPDLTVRRALGQPVTGADAARKLIEPTGSTAPPIIYQRETVAVEVSPNWPLAYEEGRWSGHVGNALAPAIIGGRYAAQWVRRDGKWLIRSEVFVALSCTDAGCSFPAAP